MLTWTRSWPGWPAGSPRSPPTRCERPKRVLNELTLPAADAIRADAPRFRQLVSSDAAQARTAALFTHGLQTRGPLELDLGDRLGTSDRETDPTPDHDGRLAMRVRKNPVTPLAAVLACLLAGATGDRSAWTGFTT